jgi:hypothetical protein
LIETLLLALSVLTTSAQLPVPVRDRDPWVFRSVLDERPRMVTLALCKEMWLAYDAQNCGLYKCWKGGVELMGAVYTTVHGDQPLTRGEAYTTGIDGPVWSAEVGGKPVALRVQWRGYFLREGRCHLLYELVLPDGRHVDMQETPDCMSCEQILTEEDMEGMNLVHGMPVLYRSFHADAIPDGVTLLLRVRTDSRVVRQRMTAPIGILQQEKIVDDPDPAKKHVLSSLPFTKDLLGANLVLFFEPLPDVEAPKPKPDTKAAKTPKKDE